MVRRAPDLDPLTAAAPPPPTRWRSVAAGYLAVQAVLGIAWWVLLLTVPSVREAFELAPEQHRGLDAFLVADAVIFIGGSAASAVLIRRASSRATLVVAFTAGGTAYATLYLVTWVLAGGSGGAGVVPMVAATAATTTIALTVRTPTVRTPTVRTPAVRTTPDDPS